MFCTNKRTYTVFLNTFKQSFGIVALGRRNLTPRSLPTSTPTQKLPTTEVTC